MNRLIRMTLLLLLAIIMLTISACNNDDSVTDEVIDTIKTDIHTNHAVESNQDIGASIAALYRDIYDEAIETNTLGSLEVVRSIVCRLGDHGYVAVDSENQIDMTEYEQVVHFCEQVEVGDKAEVTVLVVSRLGGFTKYDLKTEDGDVTIVKEYFQYVEGNMNKLSSNTYPTDLWQYTEDGYLFFSGHWFLQEYAIYVLNERDEHVALRVQPLEPKCRELNRQYILPIGYGENNMFLADWNENDFGVLNFYDLFDIFYPLIYGQDVPYVADENWEVGAIYRIPKEEFETVIMAYFNIDSETLQSKTIYDSEEATYEYKPRGFYEIEYSAAIPYPEVVGYIENSDGTITLTVNVVYPNEAVSKVYSHEVVIRPLSDGKFQYVSNQIISSDDNYEQTWHVPRLTEEEWEEIYGDMGLKEENVKEDMYWFLPHAEDCLFTEDEKEQLENLALSAAEQVKDAYKDVEITDESHFTDAQCKDIVLRIGQAGFISITENANMENYEEVEEFYSAYLENRDAMVSIFEVRYDGVIDMITFLYRENKLQTYYVEIGWHKSGIPEIKNTLVSDIAEIKLTEKGYFIYAYKTVVAHSGLREYWRIKPLSDECRELTKKYISGLSYVNYNVLVTNWNSNNVEDILMPCMFEDMYRIYTGEILWVQDGKIPAEIYEKIMTTYFPVSIEQLREKCRYDENSNSYAYEMIFGRQYPPFGEVVDYMENADGTITLTVDAVWADYNSDLAFTNTIVVRPFGDGTFRYLSNSIEQKELGLPSIVK